jgi:hypothetical protein
MSYLEKIKQAKNRFEAADMVLAWSADVVGRLQSCSEAERIRILENAKRHAESLTTDYAVDEMGFVSEAVHPWRKWLRDWGYI